MRRILNVAVSAILIGMATNPAAIMAQDTSAAEEAQASLYDRLDGCRPAGSPTVPTIMAKASLLGDRAIRIG